jgi:cell division protein FtsQ
MTRKILYISIWVIISAGLVALLVFAKSGYHETECKTMEIRISNPIDYPMINRQELESLILKAQNPVKGNYISRINIGKIERALRSSPYISSANVYTTLTGDLCVNVTQRIAIVRIINANGENYFIDEDGVIIPYQPAHPAKVMLATGNIPESFNFVERPDIQVKSLYQQSPLRKIYALSREMMHDPFFKSLIGQIYINDRNELELIPRFGEQLIMFGDTTDMHHKIGNLEAFYSNIMDKVGWTTYDTINVKYKNQVVCTN